MFVSHNFKRKIDEENNCYVKVEIEGKLSYCFLARLRNVTAAKWPDCRMALLQYGLTAICLYCNMATAIWPTAIWRRQNDALPDLREVKGCCAIFFAPFAPAQNHKCILHIFLMVVTKAFVFFNFPVLLPFFAIKASAGSAARRMKESLQRSRKNTRLSTGFPSMFSRSWGKEDDADEVKERWVPQIRPWSHWCCFKVADFFARQRGAIVVSEAVCLTHKVQKLIITVYLKKLRFISFLS